MAIAENAGPESTPITEEQRRAASQWLTHLDGDGANEAERGAFRAWLEADPRHRRAYAEAQDVWRSLEAPARRLAARRADRMARLLARSRSAPLRGRMRSLEWIGAPIAVAIAVFVWWVAAPRADLTADVATARGETRTVPLADGSTVHLSSDTAVAMDFERGRRAVDLLRGEAFFEVTSGHPIAFTVKAGAGMIRVVGTRFNVQRSGEWVTVAVADGVVEVAGESGEPVRLASGQQISVESGRLGTVEHADVAAVTAWRSGRIVFYREPLSRVVARLERERPGRIFIAEAGLRALRVSGTFPIQDADATLAAIARTLDADVISITPWITVVY
ncbi:MAG: FecR family protein [Nitrospirota bacterium]